MRKINKSVLHKTEAPQTASRRDGRYSHRRQFFAPYTPTLASCFSSSTSSWHSMTSSFSPTFKSPSSWTFRSLLQTMVSSPAMPPASSTPCWPYQSHTLPTIQNHGCGSSPLPRRGGACVSSSRACQTTFGRYCLRGSAWARVRQPWKH